MDDLTLGIVLVVASVPIAVLGRRINPPLQRLATMAVPVFVAITGLTLLVDWYFALQDQTIPFYQRLLIGVHTFWWASVAWVIGIGIRAIADLWAISAGKPGRGIVADAFAMLVYALVALFVASDVLQLPVNGILATSGVIAVVLGMVLQAPLRDFFAGSILNLENNIKPGTWLQYGLMGRPPIWGRVDQVYWRATRLVSRDGMTLVVPNATLANLSITFLAQDGQFFPVQLTFSISGRVPPNRAKLLLRAAALDCEIETDTPEPRIRIHQVDKGSINYQVTIWTRNPQREGQLRDELSERVWHHMAMAGLEPSGADIKGPVQEADIGRVASAKAMIRSSELFAPLTNDECERLANGAIMRIAQVGEPIVEEGATGSSLFLVAQGLAYVNIHVAGVGDRRVARFRPGEIFGEMSFLTGEPRRATVTAATELVVFELSREHLAPMLQERPVLYERLAELLAERRLEHEANRARISELPHDHKEGLVNYFMDILKTVFSQPGQGGIDADRPQLPPPGGEGLIADSDPTRVPPHLVVHAGGAEQTQTAPQRVSEGS